MYSIEEIKTLLANDSRGILIKEDTFIKMSEKAVFIHPVYGEWTATPKKVVLQKTTHPTEANLNRKNKNIETRKNKDIRSKTIKTNLAKYGKMWSSQDANIKNKSAETCLKRYGARSFLGTNECIKKSRKTKLEKYGDINFRNDSKIKETCLERYGATSPMKNKDVVAKVIKTKENLGLISRPMGLSWNELADELKVPRTSLQAFIRDNPSDSAIEDFLLNRKNKISDIEDIFSKNLKTSKHTGAVLGYRPDFKIENTYVNIDGLYWHSQKIDRDKKYHFKLREAFEKEGIRILQFRADEVKHKMHIVRSIIDNTNNKTNNKIYARKCVLKEVEAKEANIFLENNHMMGKCNSRFIGLFFEHELVSVAGFKIKNNEIDIDRFASKVGFNVVGGLSKLISHIRKTNTANKIRYWVDLRYGNGKSLEKIGFHFKRDVQSWQWTDFKKTYHRLSIRATETKTQMEVAQDRKMWQIYDAGQRLYELEI